MDYISCRHFLDVKRVRIRKLLAFLWIYNWHPYYEANIKSTYTVRSYRSGSVSAKRRLCIVEVLVGRME